MDVSDLIPKGSPAVTLNSATAFSESTRSISKDTKSSKFLSIDDILVGDKFTSKTVQKISGEISVTESQTRNEKIAAFEGYNDFQTRETVSHASSSNDFINHEESTALQSDLVKKNSFFNSSESDNAEEDTKDVSDAKICGHLSETFTQNVVPGEAVPPNWWGHPLWKQIYETRVSHEAQSSLTKLLLPSYLMMSQHVLGARFTFHSPSEELSFDCPSRSAVFMTEATEEPKDTQSAEKVLGPGGLETDSTNDASSVSVNTATVHTSATLPHPLHNKPRRRRQRQAYTITQLNTLEEEFKNNRYLSSEKRESMSQTLGLSENQVKAWFQNRRTKHKKQLTQQINQLSTSHQTNQRDDRALGQNFHDPSNFVFASTQHPFTSLSMIPPIQLQGLGTFLGRGYPTSTSYLSLLQKMI